MLGTRLGNWILDKELGRGGMGVVYLAHEDGASGGRQAAVKVLAAELAQEKGFLQRFQREIDILRQLRHPHIVSFYDSGVQDGKYYYAMEYVTGQNFEEILLERGHLHWEEVLDVALQVCPALKHAHDHGIIHRDIKPQNLMVSYPLTADGAGEEEADRPPAPRPIQSGVVKLTDFGVAKVFAGKQLTATGGLVGTAEYLAPEQAAGKPVSNKSDLYSLGVVLYMMLTGRPPFVGNSVLDLMHKHRYAQFDPPRRLFPEISPDLDEVVCSLLEKDPAHRPANGMVLQRRLESILRKLERRDKRTLGDVRAESTEADNLPVQIEAEGEPGPATLMSRLMRQELAGPPRGPVATFLNQPVVLVTLFLCCLAIIVWTVWFRPRASETGPETLTVAGEAQRFFKQAERFNREGNPYGAREVWRNLIRSFKDVESEKKWVDRAEAELAKLKELPPEDERWKPVREALQHARELREKGETEKAEEIWRGLDELYGNDPASREIRQEIQRDRKGNSSGSKSK